MFRYNIQKGHVRIKRRMRVNRVPIVALTYAEYTVVLVDSIKDVQLLLDRIAISKELGSD